MGQWKEESPQHQSIIRNTNGIRDLCSVNPTSIYTGVNDNGNVGNIQHAFGGRLLLSEEKAEEIRKTMLSQEETFKEQVQALHKIYDMHRSAMHEIRRLSCCAPNLSTFSTTALHLQDDTSKCSDAKAVLHHISPSKQAENHTISIKIPRSPTYVTLRSEKSAQSSLKEVDKNAINSAATEKKVRKTIDLERPPEEYLDDLDDLSENQGKETREVEKPDQVSVTSREVSNTDQRFVGNENSNITTQMAENFAREREWLRTDIGRPLERNNLESMPFKRLRGFRDDVDFLTDVKPAITIDQENSSPGLECKIEMGSSLWDNNKNDQVLHGKRKWFFDVDNADKPSAMNTKPPPCFIQSPRTGKNSPENDSSQKTSWMLAPVFAQPRGWNSGCGSEDSFVQEQAIISPSKDAKLSVNMQRMDKKSINNETQNCGHPGSRQENLMTHPKQSFQTILATHPYGGTSHLTPVVFTQGYSVGAAFPAYGLQLNLGHPAVAAQGFVFPAVNKDTEEGSGPKPLPAAWCPQGTYVQFYPYQQQVIQDHRFSTPYPSADQRSMLDGGQIESFTPQKSRSQTEHSKSMQAQTQQCHDESSSVNGPARFPRPQYFSIPSPRPFADIHIKPVENDSRILGCTLDSRESQICTQKEGRNSSTRNCQFGNPSDTEEERQVHAKVSICNDSFLGTQAMEGQQDAEGRRDCKYDLQTTGAISSKQTTWNRALDDDSKMKDAGKSDSRHSCEGNCYLMERIDTSHSAGQAVSQDLKEVHVLADKMCFCKTSDIHKHASEKKLSTDFKANSKQSQLSGLSNFDDGMSIDASQKKHWVSMDKNQSCTSKIPSVKEHTKIEDLDSSGHGSNNIGTQEEKQCRGECAQHLDHIDTYTSFYSESKMAAEENSQKVILTDNIHKRTESVQIKESEDALADDKDQPKAVYFQFLSSSGPQSQDVHCGMGETSINHVKDQISPGNDPCDLKKDECGFDEMDKENILTVRLRQCDKNESLFDSQVNQQSSRTKLMQGLPNDHPTIQRMPSSDKPAEAAKAHCQDLQENKGGSEEEEEASESLAAKILLSLAPSNSQVKGMSKENLTVTKQNALQQRGQLGCVASSSSHSSRDSTCHSIERSSARRNKRRSHDTVMQGGAVGWTKSIRGKRRRTQRPRS